LHDDDVVSIGSSPGRSPPFARSTAPRSGSLLARQPGVIGDPPRLSLRDLVHRARALRDQLIAIVCMIVLVDIVWIFALLGWVQHPSGRSAFACTSLIAMLICIISLARHLRREQREVVARLDRLLRQDQR
jgi:hypothetical protein